MLSGTRLTAFIASTDLARSEAFYVQTLGLSLVDANPYALVVDGLGAQVRISLVSEKASAEYTVLGWEVGSLDAAIDDLAGRGVVFTIYDGMGQDQRGAWQAPDGSHRLVQGSRRQHPLAASGVTDAPFRSSNDMTDASGLSPSRLAQLHDVMAGYVERQAVTGVVTLVSRRGEVDIDAIGNLSLGTDSEPATAMEADTIFRIASLTKPITAVAAMMLVEECVMRLDDPVERFLPELADRQVLRSIESEVDDTVPAERPVTLRDLLTLTFGFGVIMASPGTYPIQDAWAATDIRNGPPNPQEQPEPDEWLRQFATLPLLHQPGERWMYDVGSDLLGVLVGRAAGQPFEDFLRERIFEPLGMKDTAFYVPTDKIERLATQYEPGERGLQVSDPAVGGGWSTPPKFAAGAAGLVSTAEDLLAFSQMMLNKGRFGRNRLLARPTVELMTTDHLSDAQKAFGGMGNDFSTNSWGFGLGITTARDELSSTPGRYGWTGGLGTSWYADPAEDLTGILLTQTTWTSPAGPDVYRDFWTAVYAAVDD